jgi:hypothetical protein
VLKARNKYWYCLSESWITTSSDFSFDNLEMDEQEFNDYDNKSLDLYEVKGNTQKEKIMLSGCFLVELH